jgi:O-antigen ligase
MFYSVTGMKNWLLGDRNLFGLYVLPLMIVSLLDDLLRDRWLSKFTIICSVLGIAELLYVFSATSVTSVGVFVIGLVIMRFFPRVSSTVMIYIWSVAMPAVLFFAIVIFRLQERFAWFIEGVLGKTLTFTGRTAIWDYVIDSFSSSPAMGHGLHAYIATLNGFDFAHAHDLYLSVLYNSGVIGLGCLLLFLLMSIRPLTRASSDVQIVLSVGLGAILTMMTFEYSYYPGFLLVFCLAFVSPELRGGREPSVLRERDRVGVPFISRAVTRA